MAAGEVAPAIWGIPVVSGSSERAALFPAPATNQRVHNLATGNIERYDGSAWVIDLLGWASAYNVKLAPYNAKGDGVTDDTAAIQAAIDAAYAAGKSSVFVPDGVYVVNGTLSMHQGVTLFGSSLTGEYYSGFPMAFGATLYKPSTGTAGPIVSMEWASAIHHLNLKHLKVNGATTGIVRMGAVGLTNDYTYMVVQDVFILGSRTTDIAGTNTCYGIYFPESQSGHARYFNRFANVHITECDVAVHMGGQSNANNFTNITTRECHVHYELNGQSSVCIENNFTNLAMFSIGVLSPAPIGFKLTNSAQRNNFLNYNSEMIGQLWPTTPDATCTGNKFLGSSNEASPSYPGTGNSDLTYAPIVNSQRVASMTLPTRATGDRNTFGPGNKLTFFREVSGTLPWMNRVAGTLAAADNNCKSIIQFPGDFTKSSLNSFAFKLRIWAYAPFNLGMNMVEVEFYYRNTNQTTSAGQLCVTKVTQKGTIITGLWFLTGVAGSTAFGIALVGGNSGSNTSFDAIRFELEVTGMAYSTSVLTMDNLQNILHAATAITANDVTNGVSLLTVADTAV